MTDIKNLVSFGCSWTYGDELIDPKLEEEGYEFHHRFNEEYRTNNCYTGLLANHFNLTQENLSFPGSSLQSMQWALMWWLNNRSDEEIKNSIILVGLTGEDRVSWYDPNYEEGDDGWNHYLHSTWLEYAGPNVDTGWHELKKYHITMSACDGLSKLNYETAVRMFDGVAAKYQIPVIQFNTVARLKMNQIDTFYDLGVKETLQAEDYARGGHPNREGHKKIYNLIKKEIENIL